MSKFKSLFDGVLVEAVRQDKHAHRKDPELGYRIFHKNGDQSWSPKETFEKAYRLVTNDEKELI